MTARCRVYLFLSISSLSDIIQSMVCARIFTVISFSCRSALGSAGFAYEMWVRTNSEWRLSVAGSEQ
jgi:hypothetical protein